MGGTTVKANLLARCGQFDTGPNVCALSSVAEMLTQLSLYLVFEMIRWTSLPRTLSTL
jgi:hypothetical protein